MGKKGGIEERGGEGNGRRSALANKKLRLHPCSTLCKDAIVLQD